MINNAKINYTGLHQRPTFEGIIDYLANGQEKVKYPNRQAKQIRNHPYLTQLDGIGMFEMQEQQENAWKEQQKERLVKDLGINGRRDAGVQVQTITNRDWDKAMEDAGAYITETHEKFQRDKDSVHSKFNTRYPWEVREGRPKEPGPVEGAIAKELKFKVEPIPMRMGDKPNQPVYLLRQKMGLPIAVGEDVDLMDPIRIPPERTLIKVGKTALKMGYNTLWYAGNGTYWFFKIASAMGGMITPGVLAAGYALEDLDPLSRHMYHDPDDDGPQMEPFNGEPYEPAAVQPPKLRGGPSGSQATSSKRPKPQPSSSSKNPPVLEVSRKTGPGIRGKAIEYARNFGKSIENQALGLVMSV